ncbi:hypothetical protein DPMN_097144 [Dreissena polymorpha]|uniref:Uncharacterized protein n=1 Tax=Dreissena polymorpha TaxID=45954 RepID=A0A9D4LB80_DREPO|nr:hypothetical protein DPMN_097144 [Dreissena polymorpha]
MSPNTALHLLYGAQDQRVCPEHDCSTCWSTRAPTDDRQMTKVVLVRTCHQAQHSLKDCYPGHARERSTLRPSEEKLDG